MLKGTAGAISSINQTRPVWAKDGQVGQDRGVRTWDDVTRKDGAETGLARLRASQATYIELRAMYIGRILVQEYSAGGRFALKYDLACSRQLSA